MNTVESATRTSLQTIEGTVRAYFDALGRSDVEGIIATFTADGNMLADEVGTLAGHAQLRAALPGLFQVMSVQVDEVNFEQVREEGDVAIVRTTTTDRIRMLATDSVVSAPFRELFVLRRTAGTWRITEYIFNRPSTPGQ